MIYLPPLPGSSNSCVMVFMGWYFLTLHGIFLESVGNTDCQWTSKPGWYSLRGIFVCTKDLSPPYLWSHQGLMGYFTGLKPALCNRNEFTLMLFVLNPMQIQHPTFLSTWLCTTYLYFLLIPQSPNLQCWYEKSDRNI